MGLNNTATLAAMQAIAEWPMAIPDEIGLAGIDAQMTAIIEAERIRQAAEQERLRQVLAQLLNGGQVYNGQLPQTDTESTLQIVLGLLALAAAGVVALVGRFIPAGGAARVEGAR